MPVAPADTPAAALLRSLAQTAVALTDLVLPGGCAGCAIPGGVLCPACRHQLSGPATVVRPVPAPIGLPTVWAVAPYDGIVRAVLLAHKEGGRVSLARSLGNALASAVCATLDGYNLADAPPVAVVPVPSRASVVRSRGQDPLRRIARRAVGTVRGGGRPVRLVPLLRVHRRVADQAGLDRAQRSANLSGALVVPRRYRPLLARHPLVVVVDDVVTTGSSLTEATRALRAAGAHVLGAAVVAVTLRRLPTLTGGSCLSRRGPLD